MNTNTRINLRSSTMDALIVMSDGNPGAATALAQLIQSDENAIIQVLMLDEWGIYGSSIWVLFSDICGQDVKKMSAVIRATQQGKFSHRLLKTACEKQDYSGHDIVPVDALVKLVA